MENVFPTNSVGSEYENSYGLQDDMCWCANTG